MLKKIIFLASLVALLGFITNNAMAQFNLASLTNAIKTTGEACPAGKSCHDLPNKDDFCTCYINSAVAVCEHDQNCSSSEKCVPAGINPGTSCNKTFLYAGIVAKAAVAATICKEEVEYGRLPPDVTEETCAEDWQRYVYDDKCTL